MCYPTARRGPELITGEGESRDIKSNVGGDEEEALCYVTEVH